MAWIPSHQTVGGHVKTRRAARRLNVSIPTVVGHLHLLWHWALEHAPDGDLSKFDDEDIADGAMWEGNPTEFVQALVECGPGNDPGYIDGARQLHDWQEYGGRYEKRQQSGRTAANKRWHGDGNASASDDDADPHANASLLLGIGNAEREGEGEGEEQQQPSAPAVLVPVASRTEQGFTAFWAVYPRKTAKKEAHRAYVAAVKSAKPEQILAGLHPWCRWWATNRTEGRLIPHPATWLRGERWAEPPETPQRRPGPVDRHTGAVLAPGVG